MTHKPETFGAQTFERRVRPGALDALTRDPAMKPGVVARPAVHVAAGVFYNVTDETGAYGRIRRLIEADMVNHPPKKRRGVRGQDLDLNELLEFVPTAARIRGLFSAPGHASQFPGTVDDLRRYRLLTTIQAYRTIRAWRAQPDPWDEEAEIEPMQAWLACRAWLQALSLDVSWALYQPKTHGMREIYRHSSDDAWVRAFDKLFSALVYGLQNADKPVADIWPLLSQLRSMFLSSDGMGGPEFEEGSDGEPSKLPMYIHRLEPMVQNPAILRKRKRVTSWVGGKLQSARLYSVRTGGDAASLYKRKVVSKGQGGAVVIDASGSMAISNAAMRELLDMAPAADVAYYSGSRVPEGVRAPAGVKYYGTLTIVAENGQMYTSNRLPRFGAGNEVDLFALQWLLSRRATPRIFVTDEQFCGGPARQAELCKMILESARAGGRVIVVPSLDQAIEAFKRLRAGQPLLKETV